VFLQEHFVPPVLYVQLRACPDGVYGRAFLDFRKMFSPTKKAGHPERPRFSSRRRNPSLYGWWSGGWPALSQQKSARAAPSFSRFLREGGEFDFLSVETMLESGDLPRRGFRADSAERKEFKIPALSQKPRQGRGTRFLLAKGWAPPVLIKR
jgi:hypothetical protein